MPDYQVIARKFRPQSFKEVVGQEAIVTTLKNAIKFNRLAQAYLFCGSRGTGKTTLARILAKALNCQNLTNDCEPCNTCSCCKEITSGSSLDVLEIDGASHRGIEDIRQINETVGYVSASGGYKIYLIDEVHMLTKEAFNALLKTLEEPPPKVKFFFATTEPHKVLPTILSRCQRFNLNRIPLEKIVKKLVYIIKQVGVEAEEEALHLLAQQAEGGLRDAESLLDQIIAFEEGKITVASVNAILGLMPQDAYFELDQAGSEGNLIKAFEIAHQVFSEGKDLMHFLEGLVEHLRTILLIKLSGKEAPFLSLPPKVKEKYAASAQLYTQEQCLTLIDYLIETQHQIRFSLSGRMTLEAILLHVLRSHFRLPIEVLVRKLSELEQAIANSKSVAPIPTPTITTAVNVNISKPVAAPTLSKSIAAKPTLPFSLFDPSLSEDPTPTAADLGIKKTKAVNPPAPSPIAPPKEATTSVNSMLEGKRKKPTHHYDTLLHFAAVELEGKIQRNFKN
jgi:DNA polymerase-3 subunit gamma/tau